MGVTYVNRMGKTYYLLEGKTKTGKPKYYEAMMRFVLVDPDERRFKAERMCFRGGQERWWGITSPGPLDELVAQFAPHLGQESFFDLI